MRSRRLRGVGLALLLLLGLALAIPRLFPDYFSSVPPVFLEVVVPDQQLGYVYLFFDSRQAVLSPAAPGVYSLLVPSSGRLQAGLYPGQAERSDARVAIRYLNGEQAPVVEGSQRQGKLSGDGWTARYLSVYLGNAADFQASQSQRRPEAEVFDEIVREASAPVKKKTPATLEGIERVPEG